MLRTVTVPVPADIPLAIDRAAGERLRAYMAPRIGKVQPWAERYGIGRDTVYALWRGREPQPDTLRRIADALGITYDELLRIRAGIEKEPAPEGTGSLAEAIRLLASELRAAREEREQGDARLRAVEAEVRSLRERLGAGGSLGQPAPHGTVG